MHLHESRAVRGLRAPPRELLLDRVCCELHAHVRTSLGVYPAQYRLPVSAPALVPITPPIFTPDFSTASRKPPCSANARNPEDRIRSYWLPACMVE